MRRDERADLANGSHLAKRLKLFNPEIVFHLAAQPLVQHSYVDPLQTWNTNVIGTCHVLEALRQLEHRCVAIMITTDKVYQNREWEFSYRENDPLGGNDPYSSSKAAAELAITSWRNSFCGDLPHQTSNISIVLIPKLLAIKAAVMFPKKVSPGILITSGLYFKSNSLYTA